MVYYLHNKGCNIASLSTYVHSCMKPPLKAHPHTVLQVPQYFYYKENQFNKNVTCFKNTPLLQLQHYMFTLVKNT